MSRMKNYLAEQCEAVQLSVFSQFDELPEFDAESAMSVATAAEAGAMLAILSESDGPKPWQMIERVPAMIAALRRVAGLNPDYPGIGAGMLQTIVSECRNAIDFPAR